MTRADVIAGLLLGLGFSAVIWEASSFQYGTEFAPGPGFAPIWLSVIGLILTALMVGVALTSARKPQPADEGENPDALEPHGLLRVALALVGLVGFLILVPWVGLAIALFFFLLFLTLGVQRLSYTAAIGTSAATVCFVYLVFVLFLDVPVPSGPLGF
ncbi:MAG: tripartite tricarboxylate transporter TctB family protein [Alphaproteobacteria bacterium]